MSSYYSFCGGVVVVIVADIVVVYLNVAHYSNISEGMGMKLPYHDKVKLFDNWHNSEINMFGVMLIFYVEFLTDERNHRMRCSCYLNILKRV
jgi:hypothetical protein